MKHLKLKSRSIIIVLVLTILNVLNVHAQNKNVSGTVLDNSGQPVIGASIVVVGQSKLGTVTDIDGKFSIAIPATSKKIEVSYIGMVSQVIEAKAGTPMKIIMKDNLKDLDEVVVIGYGVVKKRDLTGSMTSIKSEDIVATPTTNALESLQGKVAGLDMTKSSGQTGSGLSFSIRGNRSLNASNTPLIIVDGIPYGTDIDINPNIIESMEILKDASSTAIYGSRGANGVILITTKKGTQGKTKVTYNGYYSTNSVAAYPERMNLQEWANFKREAYKADGQWASEADDAKIFGSAYDAVKSNQDVDWVDLLMKDGSQTSHSISISNGSEKTSFNLAFEYMKEQGLVKLDNLSRYNTTLGISHKVTKDFKLNFNMVYTFQNQNIRRDPLNRAIYESPYGDVYNEDGSINPLPFNDGQTISPIAEEAAGVYKNNRRTSHLVGNIGANWNIIKNLTLTSTFGLDRKDVRNGHFADQYTHDGAGDYSVADATNETEMNWSWENTLNYNFKIDKHDFSVMAGNALYQNEAETYTGSGHDIISPSMLFYNLGALQNSQKISSNYIKTTMASFFGRINYKFNEKYLLTLTFREDGSSVLASKHKWGFFPSAAFAWRMKEEKFLKNVEWLYNLKLRLSYGISGNSAVSAYQTQGGLGKTMYSFINNGVEGGAYGYYPALTPNTALGWEKTATTNFGIDFGFLNNRISGSIDLYYQNTYDLLMQKKVPTSTGYSISWDNIGKTENKGVEIVLNTANIVNKDFKWNTDLTFTLNREKIKELADGSDRDISNGWFVGHPIKTHYGLKKLGIWQLNETEEAAKYGEKPGRIKIYDKNKDFKIDNDNDRVILGSEVPDFVMGMNNTFRYKDFDLRVFMYWRQGQTLHAEAAGYGSFRNQGDPGLKFNYWTEDNPTNDFPRPEKSFSSSDPRLESLGYVDGSYLKIKEITLGYSLPKTWISKINASKVRVYCSLKNFFTFSHFDNYDPERGGSLSYPMTKQAVFGLNVEF
ncbi:SusC/RagA family TonB-linked outer membrane protein [Prevotella sp.]|uniref:SusC/RagA family TonB-linked outer membrane protein n=1 Tax=Prevotella sp. TaxID=59823 RepID=UPI00307FF7B7